MPAGCLDRILVPPPGEQLGDLRRGASGEAYQPGAELGEQFPVYPGPVVEPFNVGLGHQLHQVPVSGVVLGQQHQVGRALLRFVLHLPALAGDVDLAADDRLDARVAAGRVEVDHAVEGAVVGDGRGVHAQFAGPGHQLGDPADPVQHGVFGVGVQVGELQGCLSSAELLARFARKIVLASDFSFRVVVSMNWPVAPDGMFMGCFRGVPGVWPR